MTIKVTLREKPISKNRKSLYLDFYPAITDPKTGKSTRREFLGLYIPEPIKFNKSKGKLTPIYDTNNAIHKIIEIEVKNILQRAEQTKQKRENLKSIQDTKKNSLR